MAITLQDQPGSGGETRVEASATKFISDFVLGEMSKWGLKALWILVGGVIVFVLTELAGMSSLIHELKGKSDKTDQTINLILNDRTQTISTLLELQNQLMTENQNLRKQLNPLPQK